MRLQRANYVNWEELDSATTVIELQSLYGKYINHPKKIRVQIASRLRCKRLPPLPWKEIHAIVGGNEKTMRNWGTKIKGFSSLWQEPTHTLQEGENFTGPRNKRLEIALICHVINSNDAGFMLDYDTFKGQALLVDTKLRLEAQQQGITDYPRAAFVCSRDFYNDFKARNLFRTRKISGESASVAIIREEVINYINYQIQVEGEPAKSIENIDPAFIINLDETALFYLDLGYVTITDRAGDISGFKRSKRRLTVVGIIKADGTKYPLCIVDYANLPHDLRAYWNKKNNIMTHEHGMQLWKSTNIYRDHSKKAWMNRPIFTKVLIFLFRF